jgi:hypothetical protein
MSLLKGLLRVNWGLGPGSRSWRRSKRATGRASKKAQTGKELAKARGGAYFVGGYELESSLSGSTRLLVERGVCRTVMRRPRLRRITSGRVVARRCACRSHRQASVREFASERQRIDPPDKAGGGSGIVTSAPRGAVRLTAVPRLVFRLTMSRLQFRNSPAAICTARTVLGIAVPYRRPAEAAAPQSPFSPIFSTDATRSAVGRPYRPRQRILTRGERVFHGKQNDHRRLPPGGDASGGSTRQPGRGI